MEDSSHTDPLLINDLHLDDPHLSEPVPQRPLRGMSDEERFLWFRRMVIDQLRAEHCYMFTWSNRFGIGEPSAKQNITYINRMRAELVDAQWAVVVVDERDKDTDERIVGICVSIPALADVFAYMLREHYPLS
jgi:hypothetical protein